MNYKTIVDVRSRDEFAGGHVAGSINIPLNEVPGRVAEIKNLPQPILLCCMSGNRSGLATAMLQQAGVPCSNGGSWFAVNNLVNNSVNV
jgi:rhodanese-related sulfurtransferase